MIKHILSLTLVILFLSANSFAQQNLTLYNMTTVQQRMYANPALRPDARINLGIIPISSAYFNLSNSGFKIADVITKNGDKTKIDFDNFLNALDKNNFLTVCSHIDLFSFGFKQKKNYWSMNVTERIETRFQYPKDLFNFLLLGNGAPSILGQQLNFNFKFDASHFREYAIGFNRELLEDKLTVGGKLKYLYGMENIYTKNADLGLYTEKDSLYITATSNVGIYTSGVTTEATENIGNDISKYLFGKKNHGVAIDLGATYKLNDKLSFSASAIDLGFINWKEYTQNFVSRNPQSSYTFKGIDISNYFTQSTANGSSIEDAMTKSVDSIVKTFAIDTLVGGYRTYLNSQFYLSGNYHLNEKNFASALVYSQLYGGKIHPALSISYNTGIGRWLRASISYSILNRSYNNVGLGLSLNAGPLQWYIASDNVLGVVIYDQYNQTNGSSIIVPAYSKNFNVRFGFNITIGRKPKDKDKDGVVDKKDLCPTVAGLKELDGCPDKDGDKIADDKDACPTEAGLKDFNGCPDKDGDKIADKDDKCPDVAGPLYTAGCPDADNDSIIDSEDDCPQANGLKQFKGCPDKDGDGIMDKKDDCPDVAGLVAFKGCPDTDKDGISDTKDLCPNEVGPKENNGCPYKDKDGDGLLDKEDKCPDVTGPKENNGCPLDDKDGDGLNDKEDECPTVPGPKENKGCPQLQKEEAEVLKAAFSNLEFETGKEVIKQSSLDELDELAKLLEKKPTWKLKASGYTDNQGDAKKNTILSKKRAEALKGYLVLKGVSSSRITAEGFGSKNPIADNKTPEGRQKNRRVEMKIIFE